METKVCWWLTEPAGKSIRRPTRSKRTCANRSLGKPRHSVKTYAYHLTHVENFVDCMRSQERLRSDVEIGHNSMIACHLGNIAFRVGRKVDWDPDREGWLVILKLPNWSNRNTGHRGNCDCW